MTSGCHFTPYDEAPLFSELLDSSGYLGVFGAGGKQVAMIPWIGALVISMGLAVAYERRAAAVDRYIARHANMVTDALMARHREIDPLKPASIADLAFLESESLFEDGMALLEDRRRMIWQFWRPLDSFIIDQEMYMRLWKQAQECPRDWSMSCGRMD